MLYEQLSNSCTAYERMFLRQMINTTQVGARRDLTGFLNHEYSMFHLLHIFSNYLLSRNRSVIIQKYVHRFGCQPAFKVCIKNITNRLWRTVGCVAAAVTKCPKGVQVWNDLWWGNHSIISDEDTLGNPWSYWSNWNLKRRHALIDFPYYKVLEFILHLIS